MTRHWCAVLLVVLLMLGGCQQQTSVAMTDTPVQTTESNTATQQPMEGEQKLSEEERQIIDMIQSDAVSVSGDAPDADEYSWEVLEGTSQEDGILIQASIYTLQLPGDWEGKYVVEESDNWLYLYSKANQESGYGGLLGYVAWIEDAGNTGGPAQFLLGEAVMDGVSYQVVAEIMTQAQAPDSGELLEEYRAMQEDLIEIFGTIQFADHVTFTFES